jgi:hypothetical protein
MSPRVIETLRLIPYHEVLLYKVRLPKRYPRGRRENIERVRMAAAAQHQWRVAQMTLRGIARHLPGCSTCKTRVRWTF